MRRGELEERKNGRRGEGSSKTERECDEETEPKSLYPKKSEGASFLLFVVPCSFFRSFLLLSWLEECTGKVKAMTVAIYPSVCSSRKISLTTS